MVPKITFKPFEKLSLKQHILWLFVYTHYWLKNRNSTYKKVNKESKKTEQTNNEQTK